MRVEAAMRQIDDAAQREDERQAERDQQVIGADQDAVENLLEDEDELHAAMPLGCHGPRKRAIQYFAARP